MSNKKFYITAALALLALTAVFFAFDTQSNSVFAGREQEVDSWSGIKEDIATKASNYEYTEAVALLAKFLDTVKDEKLKSEVSASLEDLKGEKDFFLAFTKKLSTSDRRKKININNKDIWIAKADEKSFEGSFAGMSGSVYTRKWKETDTKIIYRLFPENPPKQDYFFLALFCYSHGLTREGDKFLVSSLRNNPEQQERISRFYARRKGIAYPSGGFAAHEGQIITAEEKSYADKGYIKFQGEWMPYDEMMQAKGFTKVNNKWIETAEIEKQEFYQRNLDKLKNLLAPKGVIDKPGADSEGLDWNKARTKVTDHYVIQTDLSQDALDDLCFLMECFYYEGAKIFKYYKESDRKLQVCVYRNSAEYRQHGGLIGSGGLFNGAQILTFYQPGGTTSVLMHEGTHQFVHMVAGSGVPLWIHEGLASYYEASKFEGTALKTNIINQGRLKQIRERIQDKSASTFDDIINLQISFTGYEYSHSWSLIYFFMNYKNGIYVNCFNKYFDGLKRKGFQDVEEHNRLFEEAFGTAIDVIERQWEEYILNLK